MQNHASAIGFLMQEMGASGTPLMYAFREREKILDLFESLTGSRMMCNYMRFGGCRVDASPAWLDATRKGGGGAARVSWMSLKRLLSGNEILMARTQGVGVLRPELAVNAGITGPMLRGSGVNYDIRKVDHYGIYDRFKFRVPLGDHGDIYRPLHGARAGDARVDRDSGAGAEGYSRRARSWIRRRRFAASGPSRARRMDGSKRPRASWAFI